MWNQIKKNDCPPNSIIWSGLFSLGIENKDEHFSKRKSTKSRRKMNAMIRSYWFVDKCFLQEISQAGDVGEGKKVRSDPSYKFSKICMHVGKLDSTKALNHSYVYR